MNEKKMIKDIKTRLSKGEELRDVARRYGMSCRAICRLTAEVPKTDLKDEFIDSDFIPEGSE